MWNIREEGELDPAVDDHKRSWKTSSVLSCIDKAVTVEAKSRQFPADRISVIVLSATF